MSAPTGDEAAEAAAAVVVAAEAAAAATALVLGAVEDSSQEAVEEEGDSTLPVDTTNGLRHDSIDVLYNFLVKRKNCKKP